MLIPPGRGMTGLSEAARSRATLGRVAGGDSHILAASNIEPPPVLVGRGLRDSQVDPVQACPSGTTTTTDNNNNNTNSNSNSNSNININSNIINNSRNSSSNNNNTYYYYHYDDDDDDDDASGDNDDNSYHTAIKCGTTSGAMIFVSDQAQLQQASQEAQHAATEAQRHLAMLGRIRIVAGPFSDCSPVVTRWQCRCVGPCRGDSGLTDCRLLRMK